ncbi:MAG: serine hydrolase domain-containing protein, partial [Candidatus Halalkalibacterium sp. M3_1C_030]
MKRHLLALIAPLVLFASVSAQTPWKDNDALESYMDGLVETYMEENNIAGATVGIVKDGNTVLLKGYGQADVDSKTAVDPERTLFRIGSISKMFVWTAVMQLAEEGKLDLEADINRYLADFKVPDTFAQPITMKNLMTHTAGFEDYVIGLFAKNTSSLKPLGEILANELPKRVRKPGVESSYSNHGTGMAAYIVEQISGLSFNEYVEQYILGPLQMQRTTFRQPLPENLRDSMSEGYSFSEGEFRKESFEYVPLAPVGAASSTAADMINFMKAHLQSGQFGDNEILQNVTARRMQAPAFSHAEAVNPMRLGFIDMSQNNIEIIGHGGDTFWFHSNMALFPQHDLGLFISFNSAAGGGIKSEVLRDFVDHYFPEENLQADTLELSNEYLQQFKGDYRPNRYPHERLTYLMALFNTNTVSLTDKGMIRTMENEKANFWFPVDSLVFRNTKNSRTLAFSKDEAGKISRMYMKELPIIAFEKVPLISGKYLHFTLFGATAISFILTMGYWPVAYLSRRKYKPDYMAEYPISKWKKGAAWVNGFFMLAFLLGMAFVVSKGNGEAIVFGIADSIKGLLILPFITIMLTLLMTFFSFRLWRHGESGVWSRLWYTFIN